MTEVLFPGQMVILDETKIPPDVSKIPIWCLIHNKLDDPKEPSYVQIDYISSNDIVLVLDFPTPDGSVKVLTCRGRHGSAWIGHLKVI